jgi:hypothetical protein
LQNGITNAQDSVASICTILRGDSQTGFEEKIKELTTSTDSTGETLTITICDKTVEEGLNAFAQMIFPFRALETQKQWMQQCMQKPKELPIQKTAAAVKMLKSTAYHSFLAVKSRINSLLEKSLKYWNGPFRNHGEPSLT